MKLYFLTSASTTWFSREHETALTHHCWSRLVSSSTRLSSPTTRSSVSVLASEHWLHMPDAQQWQGLDQIAVT